MNVRAIDPPADARVWLPGAQFADAFTLTVRDPALDARGAAQRLFGTSPHWVRALLRVRDAIVAPLGITTTKAVRGIRTDRVGMFPVLSETPERVVAGLDDSHLDFRALVDVARTPGGTRITATTIVLTHNLVGRVYLAIIKPFHRLVVRSMLKQAADQI